MRRVVRCADSGEETNKLFGVYQMLLQPVMNSEISGQRVQTTEQATEESLAPRTVRVRRTTSFRVSADLKCRLLATNETSAQSSARYGGAKPFVHLYAGIADSDGRSWLVRDGNCDCTQVIDHLNRTQRARVVVCFCEGMTIKGLVKAAKRRNLDGHFLFIGR